MSPEEIRSVEFREALHGYRPSDVDALLEQVALSIQAGQEPRAVIETARLHRAFRGYSMDEVDTVLSDLSGIPKEVAPWAAPLVGQHFGSGTVQPLAVVPDAWLVPKAHHRLEVLMRPRGVVRIVRIGTMGRMDPILWPLGWLVHWCFYPRQWHVEVVEIPEGWRSVLGSDSVVWSATCQSKQEAVAERNRVMDRIDRLASSASDHS